ncbi:zinc finger ZZ-type and EF-hand domain-containing 1-like [Paramuricea clavata]|uniref:Zinc finger ZZ-type and EF-hand domain-containing 1-like n=3 Tax=Paramuricea clavata TaxID=317549 RepID=A0A6S7KDX8_PARCT|nr:zinc finger ZZ-type and EF-hand domain-containing 1-like [Paramuricea clavata]
MLAHQKVFPRHYGDNLDGCGLDLEGRVRKTYYTFLRRLLESVRSFTGDPDDDSARSKAFSCIRAYLLHFLDIEWKPYDLDFLNDINLPEFFLDTSKVTASALQQCSTELSDQRELEEYKENMAWKEQATKGFHDWWESMQTSVKNPDEKRRLHLFLSRYAELFEVDVFCDGCKSALNRSRYRCLNCFEIDLCSTCFNGNVKPNGHTGEHEVVELRWKCDGCSGFVIGTRFNCSACTDFDLCLGCYTSNTWPDRHLASHAMKKFTKKTGLLVHQRIPAYTHTHAWFQFASLSLSLANALNDPGSSDAYGDYLYTIGILHGKCLSLIVKCLNEVLTVAKLTVEKEQEDARQAVLLKESLIKSEAGATTQPGTSEEGVVSKKSSETSSDVSEIKNAENEAGAKVDKREAKETKEESKDDVSEKDKTPDSNFVETSADATKISEKSGQSVNIAQEGGTKSEDLKSDAAEPKSKNESVSGLNTSSEPSSSTKSEANSVSKSESAKTTEQTKGSSEIENSSTKESSSDTGLLSMSSSSNIPKGPTTTPSESHSDTINPPESSGDDKRMTSQSEPDDGKTSVSSDSDSSKHMTSYKVEPADRSDSKPVTSQSEPADSKTSVSGLSDKGEKESGGAVAMVTSGTSVEDKPGGLANESTKLTQEQLDSLFVKETQENLLGLIGAMLPNDSKLIHWTSYNPTTEDFLISEFIPILLKIARSPDVVFTHRNMTIGVLGKYLQCIPPELCDKGVSSEETDSSGETESLVENERRGKQTVKSLFQFGAECLARSDLESASSVACCLQQLCQSSQWQPSITFEITQSLAVLTKNSEHPKLENIFGVLVFAGFPNVLQMGSRVEMKEQSSETKEGIALSYSTTNASAVVADIKTRKRTSIKESNLQELSFLMELYCTSQFSTLLTIAQEILRALKEQGDQVSVERMWVLYLVLKAMLSNLKGSKAKDLRNDIMNCSLIPSLVALACKGTELSRMWLLRDLEILSIKLYKKQLDGTKKIPTKLELVRTDSDNTDSSAQTSSEPLRSLIQSFQEAIQAPMALLETILPRNDQARLLEEVHRSLWNEGTIRRLQNPPSSKPKEIPETPDDNSIDIGVVRYSPGELQPKTFKAKEEDQRTCEKLMPSFTDEEIAENQRSLARLKSGNLLRAELDKDSPPELIKKVNKALCILYARHVLSRLLAEWPDDRELTSEVLDSGDEVQLIGILDLLQRIETKEAFETVVTRVVNKGEAKLIKPLSLAAAHCMGEVKLSSETKETEHPYKNDIHKEDKVHIPGAATLTIKFDSRCSSEDGCDTLILSTSQNYSEHRHEFSGQSGWIDFEIPGDTLYFVFQSDSTNTDWGWKFTVTGGQLGR